jgi:hypothetical protein
MFLLCMAEVHGCFVDGVELLARCQEAVMNRDNETLLQEMISLKTIIDQLPYIFHKISVNPNSGENFANPVEVSFHRPHCKQACSPAIVGPTLCKIQCSSLEKSSRALRSRTTPFPYNGCIPWSNQIRLILGH